METSFTLQTLDECRTLAKQLAQLCPNPETAYVGLIELLINAVEHGNLGISYTQKSLLQETKGAWENEVERRLTLPENFEKRVFLQTWRTEEEICFLIRDQGEGFDWEPFLKINPERLMHSHGRGIAMARYIAFDSLEYRDTGNEVLATVKVEVNTSQPSATQPSD